jgi:hypothetical protein
MEKIIVIASSKESHQALLRCLEILFPECVIELLPEKDRGSGQFTTPEKLKNLSMHI